MCDTNLTSMRFMLNFAKVLVVFMVDFEFVETVFESNFNPDLLLTCFRCSF